MKFFKDYMPFSVSSWFEVEKPMCAEATEAGISTLFADAKLEADEAFSNLLQLLFWIITKSQNSKQAHLHLLSLQPLFEEYREIVFQWRTWSRELGIEEREEKEIAKNQAVLDARLLEAFQRIEHLEKLELFELRIKWFLFFYPLIALFPGIGIHTSLGILFFPCWLNLVLPRLILRFYALTGSKYFQTLSRSRLFFFSDFRFLPEKEGRYLVFFSLVFNVTLSWLLAISPHWIISFAIMVVVIYAIHRSQGIAFQNKNWFAILTIVYLMDGLPILHRLIFFVLKTIITVQFWLHAYTEIYEKISSWIKSFRIFFVTLVPLTLRRRFERYMKV